MDLQAPYETVVPSLDGAVLEVLARAGKPITGRQVQRLARRGSVQGVAVVLDRLVESGLISTERAGSATLYETNRDHIMWPAVEILMSARSTLLGRIGSVLAAWQRPPSNAWLFGSAARGDGDTRSDIDILIVHDEPAAVGDTVVDSLRSAVLRWTGNHAQVVLVSESTWDELTRNADPLIDSVRRDGVSLLGTPLVDP